MTGSGEPGGRGRLVFVALGIAAALAAATAVPGSTATVSPAASARGGLVWVTNKALNNVVAFNPATGDVVATVVVGHEPDGVTVIPGVQKAYVANEGDNTVSVISTRTRTLLKNIPIRSRPHHIQATPDGSYVFFTESGTNKLGVIDPDDDTFLDELPTSGNASARAHGIWIGANTIYVTNEVTNELAVISGSSGAVIAIPLDGPPSEVVVTPDEKTAYVSIPSSNKVIVLNLRTRSVTSEVTILGGPDTLRLTPRISTGPGTARSRVLVVSLSGAPAQVVLVDTKTNAARTVTVNGSGAVAAHVFTSADGALTYVAHSSGGAGTSPGGVAVVDNHAGTVVGRFPYPGGGDPHGIFYNDPQATASPSIAIASRPIRVTRKRMAAVRLICGAKTIGACVGVVNVCAYGKTRFSIAAGKIRTINVRLSRLGFGRLLKSGTLREPVGALAADESGNIHRADRMVKLLSPRRNRPRRLAAASLSGADCLS